MSLLLQHFRTLARGNRLANHRLQGACSQLSHDEFKAPRTSFFPSLWATLNHILIVDWYYIAALYRERDMRRAFESETPCDDMRELAAAQVKSDQRLIDWLTPPTTTRSVPQSRWTARRSPSATLRATC